MTETKADEAKSPTPNTQVEPKPPAPRSRRQGAPPILDLPLDESTQDHLIEYLSFHAAKKAYERIARNEAKTRWIFSIIMGFLGLVGWQSLQASIESTISGKVADESESLSHQFDERFELLRGSIDAGVGERIETDLESVRAETQAALDLFSSLLVARKIDQDGGLSLEEADATVDEILRLADSAVRGTPGFTELLESGANNLLGADLEVHVDRLDDSLRDELQRLPTCRLLLQHYAVRLAAAPGGKDEWDADVVDRYESYEKAAIGRNLPENVAVYSSLLRFVREGRVVGDPLITETIRNTALLSPAEVAWFVREFVLRSKWEHYSSQESPKERRSEEVVGQFLDAYGPEVMVLCWDRAVQIDIANSVDSAMGRSPKYAESLIEFLARSNLMFQVATALDREYSTTGVEALGVEELAEAFSLGTEIVARTFEDLVRAEGATAERTEEGVLVGIRWTERTGELCESVEE